MSSDNFKSLYTFDTINNADTVEWCPIFPYRNSFACGTYHLVEEGIGKNNKDNKGYSRTGGVLIFTVTKCELEENDKVSCPAVLDMKWCGRRIKDKIMLAVANAIGEIMVFEFHHKKLIYLTKCVLRKEPGDFLALSLDWSKQSGPDVICASDSKGNLTVIQFSDNRLVALKEWNAHSLEAWIVCFDSFQKNLMYSGGDDGTLKVWDHRNTSSVLLNTSKRHTAGVTVVNSNIYKEFSLVSGSYDENIFFWDTRYWKNPVKTINASGGLWRLKWEPISRSKYLLGACIYGGFQIYDSTKAKSVGEYKEHESLAYGADWCHLGAEEIDKLLGSGKSALIATCSFYDHQLRVSLWKEDELIME